MAVDPSELFRFRIVRNIQAQQLSAALNLSDVKPSDTNLKNKDTGAIDPATWKHWLNQLSTTLALRGDYVEPVGVVKLLPQDWKTQVGAAAWQTLGASLSQNLVLAMRAAAHSDTVAMAATVEGLSRLLRVYDLIVTLNADQTTPAADRVLQSARDVQAALGYKLVVLGADLFPRRDATPNLVRRPGVTDLYVVRDEWNRYEAGELARVINVLPGEAFDTRLKHFEKTETTVSTTTESTTSVRTENSQTQSASLSNATSKDSSLNIGVQGQVEVSGQYGPAHIDVTAGAQLQSSQSQSDSRAMTTSMESVQRSIKEVSQTVIDVQTRRTVVGDVSAENHKLSNSGSAITVGLYRWLSEIHRCQLERYPNRFVIEFEIPEPGAWLRWAMQNAPTTFYNPDPGPFRLPGSDHDLTPLDMSADAIATLAGLWRIQGLETPPPATMTLSAKLTAAPGKQDDARFIVADDNSLAVPNGYYADAFSADIFSTRNWSYGSYGTELTVTVGGGSSSQATTGDLGSGAAFVSGTLNGHVGSVNTGTVPVSAYGIAIQGFTIVVNVTCQRMNETYRQWQQTAFDQVAAAYQNLLQAHQQEQAAMAQQPGSLSGLVGPPELNKARAAAELRRLVIEELRGQRFNGEPAIDTTANTHEPNVNLTSARNAALQVQFFEQAFEWENLVYICYPYYWARRAQWPTNVLTATEDPEFDQFLNSGSARVVVPARPGFEDLVNYFLYTGRIWGGKRPPAPNDPDYLSIAQEIQAIQIGATDGTPVGSSWEISLPTTLLWAGDDPSTLPSNSHPTIPAPTT